MTTPEDTARELLKQADHEIRAAERVAYLARKLDLTPRTIRSWCKAGHISAIQLPSGRWRIAMSEVHRLVPNENK